LRPKVPSRWHFLRSREAEASGDLARAVATLGLDTNERRRQFVTSCKRIEQVLMLPSASLLKPITELQMTSQRKRKAAICGAMHRRALPRSRENQVCVDVAPVGREFGSPDFDRLMDEDHRNRVGVFAPLSRDLVVEVEVPEDLPVQQRVGI
jgi:hypothetical protein